MSRMHGLLAIFVALGLGACGTAAAPDERQGAAVTTAVESGTPVSEAAAVDVGATELGTLPEATRSTTDDTADEAVATPVGSTSAGGKGTGIGWCDVTLTGDVEMHFKATADAASEINGVVFPAFKTRYWMDPATVAARRESSSQMFEDVLGDLLMGEITPDPHADPTVQAAMMAAATEIAQLSARNDAQWSEMAVPVFSLTCNDPGMGGGLSFQNNMVNGDDIAFAPKQYPVPAMGMLDVNLDGSVPPFVPMLMTNRFAAQDHVEAIWRAAKPGFFEITEFNHDRVAGAFAFDAAIDSISGGKDARTPPIPDTAAVHVQGTFEYRCPDANGCGK